MYSMNYLYICQIIIKLLAIHSIKLSEFFLNFLYNKLTEFYIYILLVMYHYVSQLVGYNKIITV